MSTLFGKIITGEAIVAGALATVQAFWPAYAAEIERQRDPTASPLLAFKAFNPAMDMESRVTEQAPACIIVCPGLSGSPIRRGHKYEATWTLGVGAIVAANDYFATMALAQRYAAALRALVLQHPSLGGVGSGIEWVGESYDELKPEGNSTILGTINTFGFTVEGVIDVSQGPATPPADPGLPAEWPTVETVHVDVELEGS